MTSHDRRGSSTSSYSHPSCSTQGSATSHRSSGSSRSFTTDSAIRGLHGNPSLPGAVEEEEEDATPPQRNREEQETSAVLRFYLSSLTVKRRGRWGHLHRRRARAKIIKLMEKLWVNDYPRIITRRLIERIQEAIPESVEEQE